MHSRASQCNTRKGFKHQTTKLPTELFTGRNRGGIFFRDGPPKHLVDFMRSENGDIVLTIEPCRSDGIIESTDSITIMAENIVKKKQRRLHQTEGIKRPLVVRVTSNDGYSPQMTASQMSDRFFGSGSGSMKSGYLACSGAKLQIAPAEGNDIQNGVIEITVSLSVLGILWKTVQNFVVSELYNKGISIATHDNIIMVLPAEVDFEGAAAYSYTTQQISVYKDAYIKYQLVTVHEFGHNLGFHHSGSNSSLYGDNTCLMGGENISWEEEVRMCFNAAKSWYSNWYLDRQVTVEPQGLGLAWNGKLVGIDDYVNGLITTDDDQVVLRIIGNGETDLFMLFNRVKGINSDCPSHHNMVTIVSQSTRDAPSILMSGLKGGETYRVKNWSKSGYDLVVQDCGHGREENDYAKVRIYLSNQEVDVVCTKGIQFEESPNSPPTSPCNDNDSMRFFLKLKRDGKVVSRKCKWLSKKSRGRVQKLCLKNGNGYGGLELAHAVCCKSCSYFRNIK
jgi:Gametolysin peptidase M11.